MTIFWKMHGLGNDFVVFDARKTAITLEGAAIRAIAERKRGVGCDQLIVIEADREGADAAMRILNADGGEVEMCGNAARCVAKRLMAETGKTEVAIRTKGALLQARSAGAGLFSVDMGMVTTAWDRIPLSCPVDTAHFSLRLGDRTLDAAAAAVGNPHCVVFVADAETTDVSGLGPRIETHTMFPNRTNVEFVSVRSENALRMRVWERGVGITEACGSGACAAAFAAHRRGLTNAAVQVELDGGTLAIAIENGRVRMTGPAVTVFTGEIDLREFHA